MTAAIEQTWNELDEGAKRALSRINQVPQVPLEELDSTLAETSGAESTGMCVVDATWTILTCSPAGRESMGSELQTGTQLTWIPAEEAAIGDRNTLRGSFDGAGGTMVAVAHPLRINAGYLVLHYPREHIVKRIAVLLESMPGLGALTWLWTSVLLSIASYMVLAHFDEDGEREKSRATADSMQQRQKLLRTRDAVIFGLAKLADSRDPETGDHLERISVYSTMLASVLRNHPKFAAQVTPAFVRLIGISSALHDIGKVGIEDRILLKPGPLTADERRRIQEHAAMGGDCLREIEQRLGSSNFLQMAREIAYAHHERWDGNGYPRGLKGVEIPLAARIVSIVDVYDALSSRRVYKGPKKHEECVEIIRLAAGTQFDPELVAAWMDVESKFRDIARRYADDEPPAPQAEAPYVVAAVAAQEAEYNVEKECLMASVVTDGE